MAGFHRTIVAASLALAASGLTLIPGSAQEGGSTFAPVRLPRGGEVPADEQARALGRLEAQQSDPQHIVALIHGFDTPAWESAEQYGEVAPRIKAEFDRLQERVAVLGIQWDSNVGPQRKWIPAVFGHYAFNLFGLGKVIRDPYTSRIPIARTAGRTGVRQILLAVRDRFPNARIHVMAHSMGAEVAAHAINPEFTPRRENMPVFQPERPLKLDVVTLAGADLDFDSGAKSTPVNPAAAPNLLWITLPKIGGKKDKVLTLRKKARSKAAIGNAVPSFRQDQYDTLITQRRLVFDSVDIPEDHALVNYFQSGRLHRIADAAVGLRAPERNPSELLAHLNEVLAEPKKPEAIAKHLFGNETSPKVYALWRLEHLQCGSSLHMSNGYAEKVLAKTLKNPNWLTDERTRTDCQVVKAGYWPPADVVEAARLRRLKQQDERDKEAGDFHTRPAVPSLLEAR